MGVSGAIISGAASVVGYEKATGSGTTTKKIKKVVGMDSSAPAPIPIPPMPRPNEVAAPVEARDNQRRKRQQTFQGRNSTILTGSLGIPNEANGTRKTLLGA